MRPTLRGALLLLALTPAQALLLPTDRPPLLSSPTFSLATLDASGGTNMNLLTYATPAGIAPERMWAVSLYRETATYENWLRRRSGTLQLLRSAHAPLTHALGGTSAREGSDKASKCAALGFAWEAAEGGGERVLPGCEKYLRLEQVGELIPCGEHDLAVCRVVAMLEHADGAGDDFEPPAQQPVAAGGPGANF